MKSGMRMSYYGLVITIATLGHFSNRNVLIAATIKKIHRVKKGKQATLDQTDQNGTAVSKFCEFKKVSICYTGPKTCHNSSLMYALKWTTFNISVKLERQILMWFIFFIAVFDHTEQYFIYSMAAIIIVGGNKTVPGRNPFQMDIKSADNWTVLDTFAFSILQNWQKHNGRTQMLL